MDLDSTCNNIRYSAEPIRVAGSRLVHEEATRSLLVIALSDSADQVIEGVREAGWRASVATDLQAAHRLLQKKPFLLGLLVCDMGDEDGFAAVDAFLKVSRSASVHWVGVFHRRAVKLASCRDLILEHLFDHHTLPVDAQHLALTLGHAHGHASLHQAAMKGAAEGGDLSIIGTSDAVKLMLQQIRRVATVDAPVLVTGESGSGKELAAQAIHRCSARSGGPFIDVNCGAIQPTLIQSALFGHVKGAFTGAARDEQGLIEAANGGTIFLDEIGDLSLDLQINLLRFLQEQTIKRVGSTRSIPVDVRVVAATHVDLEQAVADGTFRSDLYYRLNVLAVNVAPLRERRPDIALLARHVFDKYRSEKAPQVRGFSQGALRAMTDNDWPGNVRELINRVRRAMVMAEGRLISPGDLGLEAESGEHAWDALGEARSEAERSAIQVALQVASGNVTDAAKHLGVSRMTLYRLLAKHSVAN